MAWKFDFEKSWAMMLQAFQFRRSNNPRVLEKLPFDWFNNILANHARGSCGFDKEGWVVIVE